MLRANFLVEILCVPGLTQNEPAGILLTWQKDLVNTISIDWHNQHSDDVINHHYPASESVIDQGIGMSAFIAKVKAGEMEEPNDSMPLQKGPFSYPLFDLSNTLCG